MVIICSKVKYFYLQSHRDKIKKCREKTGTNAGLICPKFFLDIDEVWSMNSFVRKLMSEISLSEIYQSIIFENYYTLFIIKFH